LKGLFALLIIASFPFALLSEPSQREMSYAFNAIYDGVFSSVAANVTISPMTLQGVSLLKDDGGDADIVLSFNRSDMAKIREAFSSGAESSPGNLYGWLVKSAKDTFSPLSKAASARLEKSGYEPKDAVLDGALSLRFAEGVGHFSSWLELVFRRPGSKPLSFSVDVSVVVSGTYLSSPLLFEGVISGNEEKGSDGSTLTLSTDRMTCNGRDVTVSPMTFSL